MVIGKVSGDLIIESDPFIKQMICGIRTESGFSHSLGVHKSRLIINKIPNSSKEIRVLPAEITEFDNLSKVIHSIIFEISDIVVLISVFYNN